MAEDQVGACPAIRLAWPTVAHPRVPPSGFDRNRGRLPPCSALPSKAAAAGCESKNDDVADSYIGRTSVMMCRRGATSSTLVGVLATLGVLVLGVGLFVYFGSDVYRTKANAAYRGFAEWTPENIAKYPADYLNFCEAETNKALERLKASEIAIAQKRAKLESMRDENKELVVLGRKALDELKREYKRADAESAWPLSWRGNQLDRERTRRQIVKLDKDLRGKEGLLIKYQSGLDQLQAQANKVQDARDLAKEQLAKIDSNREMLKLQEITSDLKGNLVAMKGVIETSVVGVAAEESGPLSLTDLKSQGESAVNEEEFDKILAK